MTEHSNSAYCRGCGCTDGEQVQVAEMMFRSGESFEYFHCKRCESFSRIGTPANLSQYYDPDRYYSFGKNEHSSETSAGNTGTSFRQRLMRRRDAGELFQRMPDRLLSQWKPNPALADLKRYLACLKTPDFRTRILDVGCGGGNLVQRMRQTGFRHVIGIDAFLPDSDIVAGELLRCELADCPESDFALVMMHHVLEHHDNPACFLEEAGRRLAPGGVVLVRVPVVTKSTWDRFGVHWAEFDPPRHAYLPTINSLEQLGRSVGLHVHRVDYEAEPFAFAASQIARSGESFAGKTTETNFPPEVWHEFQKTAMQFAIDGEAPRVAMHFCKEPTTRPIVRLAVATSDPIDAPTVPVKELGA